MNRNRNRRFKQAIKVQRVDCGLSIHDGRHGFATIGLYDTERRFAQRCPRDGQVGVALLLRTGGSDLSRKELDDLTEFAAIYGAKGMAWIKIN